MNKKLSCTCNNASSGVTFPGIYLTYVAWLLLSLCLSHGALLQTERTNLYCSEGLVRKEEPAPYGRTTQEGGTHTTQKDWPGRRNPHHLEGLVRKQEPTPPRRTSQEGGTHTTQKDWSGRRNPYHPERLVEKEEPTPPRRTGQEGGTHTIQKD